MIAACRDKWSQIELISQNEVSEGRNFAPVRFYVFLPDDPAIRPSVRLGIKDTESSAVEVAHHASPPFGGQRQLDQSIGVQMLELKSVVPQCPLTRKYPPSYMAIFTPNLSCGPVGRT
jgi:hypothetical protein